MCISPAVVRAYDIRGRFGRDLRLDDARALGAAYAAAARRTGRFRIAVGRDGRLSSPELEAALIEGLVSGGMQVLRTGLGPTPQLYFAVHAHALDGGIMVTASHNPAHENGFKLLLGNRPVYGAALRALLGEPGERAPNGGVVEFPVRDEYVRRLAEAGAHMRPLRVVWDCGNGAAGALIEALTARLPGRHLLLHNAVDGRFPAHHPDPTVPANLRDLQAEVLARGADAGVAFDGDGDRIGLVDETGTIVWSDQLLLLLAHDVLASRPGATVVGDVKSSQVLFDGVANAGGRPVMAPSGYVLVREAMLRERAPLAGEMSGHIILTDRWYAFDDALYVAIRALSALSRRWGSLAAFRRSLPPTAATPELRLPCPDERKHAVVRDVSARLAGTSARVDTTDGLRVTTGDGWWLLRASGTEPRLTVRCEGRDEDALTRLRSAVAMHLRESGVDTGLLDS